MHQDDVHAGNFLLGASAGVPQCCVLTPLSLPVYKPGLEDPQSSFIPLMQAGPVCPASLSVEWAGGGVRATEDQLVLGSNPASPLLAVWPELLAFTV